MRRLALSGAVVLPVAAAAVAAWLSGLAWPIATTAYALLAGRRPGPNDEEDLIG